MIDPSSPAQKVTVLVEFLSIYPTLCDLAGLKKPLNLDGESLVEVVKDKKTDTAKILAEELYDYARDPDETVNVAANSDYADALQQMKGYWEEYKKTRIVRNEKESENIN